MLPTLSTRFRTTLWNAATAALLVASAAPGLGAQQPFVLAQWIRPVPRHSVLAEPGYYVWGGSVVEEAGTYHMFYSRWPTSPHPFSDGWLFASEICHAVASSADGPFVPTGVVLGKRANDPGLAFWDSQTQHNPHIRRFGGRLYLYYMASVDPGAATWPGISQRNRIQRNQRIGVIEAASIQDLITGNFARPSAPILSPIYSTSAATDRATNPSDFASNRIVNNQSVIERPDGSFQLVYKSNWPQWPNYGHGFALAPTPTGPFTQLPPPIFSDQSREDENHWYDAARGTYFLLCKNFGAGGTEQLESADSVGWTSRGVQIGKVIPWADGVNEPVEALERPHILRAANGEPCMLYMAARRTLPSGAKEAFNVHIPLQPPSSRATLLDAAAEIVSSGALVQAVNFGATVPATLGGIVLAPSGTDETALAATFGLRQAGGAATASLRAGLVDAVYDGAAEFEDVLDSIVWQSGPVQAGATLAFDLTGLTPGRRYRCDLLFGESRPGTPARHGPQTVRVDAEPSLTFDYGPASSLVAPGARAVLVETRFTATAATAPVVLTQMVAGGGGLQIAAFMVHDITAEWRASGSGCPAGAPLTLDHAGSPTLGEPLSISINGLPAATAAATLLFANSSSALSLDAFGAPGCALLVDWIWLAQPLQLELPAASLSFTLGTDPRSIGLVVEVQGLALVPGANPLGILATNRGTVRVGG